MTTEAFEYEGSELELFAAATNWRSYWCSHAQPFIGSRVLEVGAGLGSVTRSLWNDGIESWLAVEPDPALSAQIARRAENFRGSLRAVQGTLDDVDKAARFDTILYIDVLEHIEADFSQVKRAAELLLAGGHLVILSPAHQFLYSPFDKAIGHFRRYDRRSIGRLQPQGCTQVVNRYLDSVGMLASLANRMLLRASVPTSGQVALWDTRLVPMSRKLDSLTGHAIGKSLLTVWRKDAPERH